MDIEFFVEMIIVGEIIKVVLLVFMMDVLCEVLGFMDVWKLFLKEGISDMLLVLFILFLVEFVLIGDFW